MERRFVWSFFIGFWIGLFWLSPALAESRSTTIKVSCIVAPAIGLSGSPKPAASLTSSEPQAQVWNNLQDQYRLDKITRQSSQGTVELYSVTAL